MPGAGTKLRVLIVEDSADDAELLLRELRRSHYEPAAVRVESAPAMRAALKDQPWDIIFSDYVVPGFSGMQALQIAHESGLDLPFILVSGKVDEQTLVEAMKAGASDFLFKGHLGRLGSVIKHELNDAAARRGMRQAELEWRMAFDAVRDAIFVHDADYRVVRANRAYAALARMPVQEVIGKHYWEAFPRLDGPLPGCLTIMEGRRHSHEEEFALPTGEIYLSRSFPVLNEREQYLYSFHVLQNITERKRAQDEIELKNAILQTLQETSLDAILVVDENRKIIACNRQFTDLWRIPRQVVAGDPDAPVLQTVIAQVNDPEAFTARVNHLHENRNKKSREELELKDGRVIDRYSAPVTGAGGRYYGRVWYFRDISARKLAQAELEEREQRFRSMIENASDLILTIDAGAGITYASPSLERIGGYAPRDVLGRSIMEFTHPEDLPAAAAALAAVLSKPDEPHRAKIRWRRKDGGIVTLESVAKNALANPALRTIVINARDATARLRAEEEIRHYIGELESAFMQSVTVATTICEMRDPYTVGHERRVAELSVAISAELGFDKRQQEGLRVAGFLHDVGKIIVPAEILVKPTKLTPTEFELIKGHAQASFDVLKTVTFPWPVAEIAYQHHERLDGSGYPRRLKGDAILFEARILAVADTVEAMHSHRPYRAGLGIDKALAEIQRGRGCAYDPAVVDACVKLFAEKRFAFST